jgi:hypothetical protein
MDKIQETGQKQLEKFIVSEKIIPGKDGWLSPSGQFFKADGDQHEILANWIVSNNLSELKKGRRPKDDLQYLEESGLPSREFLRDKGWILLNGQIFRTDNALNYTTKQLELLSEARIPIVGAYDGSKEFSSLETLEWVNLSAKNIANFIETQKNQILKWSPERGYEPTNVSQDKFWENIESRGYSTLEDFKRNPFHTIFGDFGRVSFTDVRDVLSQGYHDEIVFDQGQETYTLRLVELGSGEKICIEYTFHHHIGHGSGNEEHMNIYVIDNFIFKDKIKKYISSGINPQITGDYFRELINNK